MALTDEQIEAAAQEAYAHWRAQVSGAISPSPPLWAGLSEEQKEGWRAPFREPASVTAPSPTAQVRVFLGESRPTDPPAPSLWIPTDEDGTPATPSDWEVFA